MRLLPSLLKSLSWGRGVPKGGMGLAFTVPAGWLTSTAATPKPLVGGALCPTDPEHHIWCDPASDQLLVSTEGRRAGLAQVGAEGPTNVLVATCESVCHWAAWKYWH